MQTLLADVLSYLQEGRNPQEHTIEDGAYCIDITLFVYLVLIHMMEFSDLR